MIFDYLDRIENKDLFQYAFIGFVVFTVVTRVFKVDSMAFIGMILAGLVLYYLNDKKESNLDDFNKDTEFKLVSIVPAPKMFHTDVNMINLFHDLADYQKMNEDAYRSSIKSADAVLQIHEDMKKGVKQCKHNYEIAQELGLDAVNHFNTFLMSLPSSKLHNDLFEKRMRRFRILIRRHIDDIYLICRKREKTEPITTQTGFVTNHGPRPDDTRGLYNEKWHPNYNYGFDYYV